MIGPRARRLLRRLAAVRVAGTLGRRLGIWTIAVLAASQLGAAAGLLGLISKPSYDAFLIVILSTFPLALFYPPDPRSGLRALRSVDDRAVLESALAATGEEASEPLLRSRGEALASGSDRNLPRPPGLSRGDRRFLAAAAAVIIAVQTVSLLIVGRPVLGYVPAPSRSGRAEEGSESFARLDLPGQDRKEPFDRDRDQEEAPEKTVSGGLDRMERQAEFADLHGLLRTDSPGSPGESAGEEERPEGLGRPDSPLSEETREGTAGGGTDRAGRTAGAGTESAESGKPGEAGQAPGPQGREQSRSPGSGWSDSPGDLGRNAMKDYRAEFEKIYTERTSSAVTAGTELSLEDLETALDRYFNSFRLRVGVDPDEDPLASSLRAAWLRLRGGLK